MYDDIPIKFCDIPFTILNKRTCRCHQGKNKDAKMNDKKLLERRENPSEHYIGFKERICFQVRAALFKARNVITKFK